MVFTRSRSKGRDAAPLTSAERARRRLRIFALGIAALFGAVALLNWWTGRDNPREGSRVITSAGGALRLGTIPTTYRAVYRVENRAGKELVVTTEKYWVRRPFESRIESWRGAPPGTERLSVRHSAFGVLTNESPRSAPLNITVPPSLASGDLRIDAIVNEAAADKTILRREQREVYGRRCQVYRTGGPVFAGELTRYRPGRGSYADVCVDRQGLVLEEAWFDKDRLIQRRVATEVEIAPKIASDTFDISAPPRSAIERGSVKRTTQEGDLWLFEDPPTGFEAFGLYSVAIAPSAVPRLSPDAPSIAPISTSDVYVRGADLLVVDQDPSLASVTSHESRQQRIVEVKGFKSAHLIFDARMSEFRAEDPNGSIVRVYGTLSPSQLLAYARTLKLAQA